MFEKLARKNILALAPYSSARSEYSGKAEILLDANENCEWSAVPASYAGKLERYPDPKQRELKEKLAKIKRLSPDQIFIGNGSDEAIDLLIRVFCEPRTDSILIAEPTYGMYEVQAAVQDVTVIRVPLGSRYDLDPDAVLNAVTPATKLTFLCSPNNPTGNRFSKESVLRIAEKFQGLLVIDEAYADFAGDESWLSELARFPRLAVLQTLSKSFGLAGARVGFLFGHPELVSLLGKVKYPYNMSALAQTVALKALDAIDQMREAAGSIARRREELSAELKKIPGVLEIFPSEANFLLVRMKDASAAVSKLREAGVIIRDRSRAQGCAGCVRITVGSPEDNSRLIAALRGESKDAARSAVVRRGTKETQIQVELTLDGSGRARIATGLGFFDHMLEQIAKHSGMDLYVSAAGDLHVDEHHTVEDTGIAIGAALKKALGEKRGIERYGFVLPMDEARATVALDLSGRSYLVWNVKLSRERVGELPTEMVQHFFRSLSDAAGMTLHVDAVGENDHHIIEAIFKGFARALRAAITRTGSQLPSTKGVL